ncbi:molybdopterin converting factor small subunit [Nonomuraea thailandensis]|uniref:Molybdopterin converting factor small subunit n=1 Tax=Nonomuraea thailandensis TaxID=1188745 RepID=A0A9X2GNE5_9ACTN|nr:MoaD/ThiS family protein [Nonomuraea thailandensis]MCP2357858.1 molybdopterin converting factor small subunit [Nonomuraea thailandensis]
MEIKVDIPTPLRAYTSGQRSVRAAGGDLAELLENLDQRYPGLRARLVGDDGRLRRFINVFINDGEIPVRRTLDAPLAKGDNVTILAAVAGGA